MIPLNFLPSGGTPPCLTPRAGTAAIREQLGRSGVNCRSTDEPARGSLGKGVEGRGDRCRGDEPRSCHDFPSPADELWRAICAVPVVAAEVQKALEPFREGDLL